MTNTHTKDRAYADRMRALLMSTDSSGQRVYSDQIVVDFMPFLLLRFASALDPAQTPPQVLGLLGKLAEQLGVADADGAAMAQAITSHFRDNPPPAALIADFERLFRELAADGGGAAMGAAIASAIGSVKTGPLSVAGAARPAGTIAAGPLARMQLGAGGTSATSSNKRPVLDKSAR